MDSFMRIEFPADDVEVQEGIKWFIQNQGEDGGWKSAYGKTKHSDSDLWITFAVCRVLKYFLS